LAFGLRDLAQVFIAAEDGSKPAFDSFKRSLDGAHQGIGKLQGLLAGLGVTLSTGALLLMVKQAIDAQAALDDLSESTSLTVETLSSLERVAHIGGRSLDSIAPIASKFAKSVAEAAGGNRELLRSFDALGISQERLRTSKFDDLFVEFAGKIANATNRTYAIAHATDLAGKSAAGAIPFFRDLSEEGLKQARVTEQQAAAAENLQKDWRRLTYEAGELKNEIATGLVPWLTNMIEQFREGSRAAGGFWEGIRLFGLGIAPGEVGQRLQEKEQELAAWQSSGPLGRFFRKPLGATYAGTEGDLNKQIDFLKLMQRQQDRAAIAANPFFEDAIVGNGNDVANLRAPPGTPDMTAANAYEAMLSKMRQQLVMGQNLTEVEKLTIELQEKKYAALEPRQRLELTLLAQAIDLKNQDKLLFETELALLRERSEERAVWNQLGEQANRLRNDALDDSRRRVAQANDELAIAEKELSLMGLSVKERTELLAQFRAEIEARKTINELIYNRRVSLSDEEQANIRERAQIAAAAQARAQQIREQMEAHQKLNEDLSRSLTDALLRGFESGKGFAQNFRDTLKNIFQTLVLRPVIQWVISPVTGAITAGLSSLGIPGLANAASSGGGLLGGGGLGGLLGGGGLGGLSSFSGLGSMFTSGATGLVNSGNAVFQNAGVNMGSQFVADIGNFGYGTPILGGIATYAATGNAGAGIGSTLGGIVGSYFGPVGTVVGSAIGGMIGGAFGGGKKEPKFWAGKDFSGVATIDGLINTNTINISRSQSGQEARWAGDVGREAVSGIEASVRRLFDQYRAFANELGLDAGRLSGVRAGFNIHVDSPGREASAQEVIAAFNAQIGQISDALALQLVPGLEDFAQANETAAQTLSRMVITQQQLIDAEAQVSGALVGMVRGLPGQLGINGLLDARNQLAVSDFQAPLDRFGASRDLLMQTYARGVGGDLSAVQAFPQLLQSALGIGRDVFASGPAFQEIFRDGNRMLNELLAKQQELQTDLLRDVPATILEASNDQITAYKKGVAEMVGKLSSIETELRSLKQALS